MPKALVAVPDTDYCEGCVFITTKECTHVDGLIAAGMPECTTGFIYVVKEITDAQVHTRA